MVFQSKKTQNLQRNEMVAQMVWGNGSDVNPHVAREAVPSLAAKSHWVSASGPVLSQ